MKQSTKTITLVIGTVLGALLGYRVALNFVQESESQNRKTPITAQQGLQVALSALGLLRQLTGISHGNK